MRLKRIIWVPPYSERQDWSFDWGIQDSRWNQPRGSPFYEVKLPEKVVDNLRLIHQHADALSMRGHMTAHEMLLHVAEMEGGRFESNVRHAPVTMESREGSEYYCEVFLTCPLEFVLSKDGKATGSFSCQAVTQNSNFTTLRTRRSSSVTSTGWAQFITATPMGTGGILAGLTSVR
ncbi:hypothetical protein FA95DRAFT_1593771 [Auriscalpium vulgare]|uniref:Uncharacterized protein n=1 Tax=Auriscalpium vulgare TaxID=40419 RepID=A0ACB8S3I7_9AGAM|nr:hypothetical protein FA95DRAFT_1593771 [Auriscalpium vulgare]